MRILGIDLETTGLDTSKDYITEVAWVVKDVGDPKPLRMQSHFIDPECDFYDEKFLTPEIRRLTKITPGHLAHGTPLEDVFRWLHDDIRDFKVDCLAAHNGQNFDRPFLQARTAGCDELHRATVFSPIWIDTSVDCVYPEDCRYTNLMYVAAYHGLLNPFPHAALFDVMTMLKVLDKFDIGEVVRRAASPWCVVRAMVDYDSRQLAKERRFSWETLGTSQHPKQWVKRIKECDFEKERDAAPFQIVKL